MPLRTWTNGLTAASIVVALGFGVLAAIGQWRLSDWKFWIVVGITVVSAATVFVVLRPVPRAPSPAGSRSELESLKTRLDLRDVAFLKIATNTVAYPKDISDLAIGIAPSGVTWPLEDTSKATERARRLIDLGVLQWRDQEVQTTRLGKKAVDFIEG